jgi:hypothetical protein
MGLRLEGTGRPLWQLLPFIGRGQTKGNFGICCCSFVSVAASVAPCRLPATAATGE